MVGGESAGSHEPGEPMAGEERLTGFGGKREPLGLLSCFSAGRDSSFLALTNTTQNTLIHSYAHTNTKYSLTLTYTHTQEGETNIDSS